MYLSLKWQLSTSLASFISAPSWSLPRGTSSPRGPKIEYRPATSCAPRRCRSTASYKGSCVYVLYVNVSIQNWMLTHSHTLTAQQVICMYVFLDVYILRSIFVIFNYAGISELQSGISPPPLSVERRTAGSIP